MSSAGQQLVAGRIPGERIATSIETSDSADFTGTAIEIQSVTAALVAGRVYRVRTVQGYAATSDDNGVQVQLLEDSTSGTEFARAGGVLLSIGTYTIVAEGEFTAASTANKTFVAVASRAQGTGNCRLEAAAGRPAFMYVDYIRG